MGLDSPIRYLKGVGEKRASEFAKKGIHTVGDLLYFFPRSHEDRSKVKPIARCIEGETVCIRAKVYNLPTDRYVRRNMLISSMQVFDDSGMINLVCIIISTSKTTSRKARNTSFLERYRETNRDVFR